jgi:hypothetical protein
MLEQGLRLITYHDFTNSMLSKNKKTQSTTMNI